MVFATARCGTRRHRRAGRYLQFQHVDVSTCPRRRPETVVQQRVRCTPEENVSATEPASLLVVFVAPTGAALKIADKP
jgi:hypothetical protein